MKTTCKAMLLVLATGWLAGCASFNPTVIVGKEDVRFYEVAALKDCHGVQFKLTVKQTDKQGVEQTYTSTGTVAAGRIEFTGLKDVDYGRPVVVELEIVGDKDCGPFMKGKKYTTKDIAFHKARDIDTGQSKKDVYIVDVKEFKEK